MTISYSFIIPVFNRPQEVGELLQSLAALDGSIPFEIVIVEDGSTSTCEAEIERFPELDINYLVKENSGPGRSRNYGMERAKGNYFIILDSDCLLPAHYLLAVDTALQDKYVDCFGGPDTAHESFSDFQKAINYSMTSILTTGGIRGGNSASGTFQPRSFNMGLSRAAFQASKGFGDIHPGEDPDLVLRLWKLGYESRLLKDAFVFHKRRISWKKFYKQVNTFGKVRPILNKWHPESAKLTYWFPTFFIVGAFVSFVCLILKFPYFLLLLVFYSFTLFVHSLIVNRSLKIASFSLCATFVQFFGYGKGFLVSTIAITWGGKLPRKLYPHLFFN